jgi:hypothetical protein
MHVSRIITTRSPARRATSDSLSTARTSLATSIITRTTLRPLLKLTAVRGKRAPVTKGIYLRKREELILRIEARSPNDDEGTYQLSFGGSFEPIVGGPEIARAETPYGNTLRATQDEAVSPSGRGLRT